MTNTSTCAPESVATADFMPLKAIHHIELWVGNATQAAYFYRKAFGFSQVAYSGLETGNRAVTSHVLEQGEMTLVLSSPLTSGGEINDHVNKHGDGVRDISFLVDDADACFREALKRGAKAHTEPHTVQDDNGSVRKATICTYGDTVHTFLSVQKYQGPFLPGYVAKPIQEESTGLRFFDHVVANVEHMDTWTDFYAKTLGFSQLCEFTDEDISTEYSALMSKVMQNGSGRIKFPINEPAEGKKKSQIEEYLDFYNGAGVQHIAVATDDIVSTVSEMRDRGVEFLYVPENYYDDLIERVGEIDEDVEVLKKHGVLIDRDDEGYLLQLFTKPVVDRPTMFFEIIQRKGAQSFGKGNFKALFEAIEREQENRGTL
jgi:4-hydroxyphenylpyruvate dioxygenase